MDRDGQLRLSLSNVYGKPPGEEVDVILCNQNLTDNRVARANAAKRILVKDLYGAPQGLYRIEIDPPSYLPVSQFVTGGPVRLFRVDSRGTVKEKNLRLSG